MGEGSKKKQEKNENASEIKAVDYRWRGVQALGDRQTDREKERKGDRAIPSCH